MPYDVLLNDSGIVGEDKHQTVYRYKHGQLYYFNSHCTHEQCDIEWQAGDKCWGYSRYGARYAGGGQIINERSGH